MSWHFVALIDIALCFSKVRLQAIKKMEDILASALRLGDAEAIQVVTFHCNFLFLTMDLLFEEDYIISFYCTFIVPLFPIW